MARTDKTESAIGVTRAPLDVDIDEADWNLVRGIGITSDGHAVIGSGNSGIVGVAIFDKTNYRAGTPCDIFGNGSEIVECAGLAAGTKYYVSAAGTLSTLNTDTYVGFTVEADRLVVTL
jgi:hypothetical protein